MSLTGQDKNSASLKRYPKAGSAWLYDQSDITYDMAFDAEGREVFYDGVGVQATLSGQNKPSASSLTAVSKITA